MDIKKQFYDNDEKARQSMTMAAIAARRTLIERWETLALESTGAWEPRAHRAASLLKGIGSVVDFGCGGMTLERFLPPGTRYLPVDVVRRDSRTVVIDLNEKLSFDIPAEAAVAIGLLEYLFDVPLFLTHLGHLYPLLVCSYNPADMPGASLNRPSHGWVNAFTRTELESIFASCGYCIQEAIQIDDHQMLWRLCGESTVSGRGA